MSDLLRELLQRSGRALDNNRFPSFEERIGGAHKLSDEKDTNEKKDADKSTNPAARLFRLA